MEKQPKQWNKLLKILPKSVTVTFQNPPFSPGRDHKSRSHGPKGFSGPMIPDEARRKPKDGGIETQEPTSPKVSCMGQIKHKKKRVGSKVKKGKSMSLNSHAHTKHVVVDDADVDNSTPRDNKKKHESSKFQRMFFPKSTARKTKKDSVYSVTDRSAPPLGEMRRFASGRETFSNFDWTAQIAPEEIHQRDCYTDDERVESDEDEVMIPFSAPLTVGAGGGGTGRNSLNVKPRKEINLWKRRTMEPPRPLQLNPVLTAK